MITDKMIDDFLEIGKDFCFSNKDTAKTVLKQAFESKGYEVEKPKSKLDQFNAFMPKAHSLAHIRIDLANQYNGDVIFITESDYDASRKLAIEAINEILSQNSPISATIEYKKCPDCEELKKRLKKSKEDRIKKAEKIKELESHKSQSSFMLGKIFTFIDSNYSDLMEVGDSKIDFLLERIALLESQKRRLNNV